MWPTQSMIVYRRSGFASSIQSSLNKQVYNFLVRNSPCVFHDESCRRQVCAAWGEVRLGLMSIVARKCLPSLTWKWWGSREVWHSWINPVSHCAVIPHGLPATTCCMTSMHHSVPLAFTALTLSVTLLSFTIFFVWTHWGFPVRTDTPGLIALTGSRRCLRMLISKQLTKFCFFPQLWKVFEWTNRDFFSKCSYGQVYLFLFKHL